MIVEEAVIWFNVKLGRWVFSIRVMQKDRYNRRVHLEHSIILPKA